jgi:hypothetical protein
VLLWGEQAQPITDGPLRPRQEAATWAASSLVRSRRRPHSTRRRLRDAKTRFSQLRFRARANPRHAPAFEAVCARLQHSVGSGDRLTELAGRTIIEPARAGEHDADRLVARVLTEFGIENDGSLWRH